MPVAGSRTATAALLAVVALGTAEGCGGDSRPAQWGYIAPVVMEPNCATASCHSRAAAAAGLDFSDADRGYKSLTGLWTWIANPTAADKQTLPCGTSGNGVPVCYEYFRPLVTPYVPGESRLVNVLRARGAVRMPPDRPLNEADIRLIEQWILDGAKRDVRQLPDARETDGGANDAPAADATTPDGGGPDSSDTSDASDARDASDAAPTDASSTDADGAGVGG